MKINALVAALLLTAGAGNLAHATTLSSSLNVDDKFSLYISTDDSQLGTLVGSAQGWEYTYTFDAVLTNGVTNYIHVVSTNLGGPAGFLGSFSLSDSNFKFANGTNTLTTNASDWKVSTTGFSGAFSPAVISGGANGVSPWGNRTNNSPSAQWIWSSNAQNGAPAGAKAYFSATVAAVPEPETFAMLLAGLGVLGTVARRRKQQ